MPKPKKRARVQQQKARETQRAQEQAEATKLTYEQYQRRRFFGWALVVVGVAVAVSHWIQHLGAWELMSPGWSDLLIGYPTGGLLAVAGAIVLSK